MRESAAPREVILFEEWEALKRKHDNRCAHCKESKPLTKDHILPLSAGGTDYIQNIQPLCRNCNSRKWAKLPVYQNPELLPKVGIQIKL